MAKKTCDVTRYADEYYSFQGVSPFATKSISKGEATSIAKWLKLYLWYYLYNIIIFIYFFGIIIIIIYILGQYYYLILI